MDFRYYIDQFTRLSLFHLINDEDGPNSSEWYNTPTCPRCYHDMYGEIKNRVSTYDTKCSGVEPYALDNTLTFHCLKCCQAIPSTDSYIAKTFDKIYASPMFYNIIHSANVSIRAYIQGICLSYQNTILHINNDVVMLKYRFGMYILAKIMQSAMRRAIYRWRDSL